MSTPVVPITVQTRANNVAVNLVNNFIQAAETSKKALASGYPANGTQPAIAGSDIQTALGTDNLALVNSLISTLGV